MLGPMGPKVGVIAHPSAQTVYYNHVEKSIKHVDIIFKSLYLQETSKNLKITGFETLYLLIGS